MISKSIISVFTGCLVLFTVSSRRYTQEPQPGPVRVMIYNVENLFDTVDDSLRDDNAFLPGGVMKWNYSRYIRKINSLYKTIVAAGSPDPPDIIAMCEVESRRIMEDLVFGTYLVKYDYKIIHEDSPDRRGIDVCLIYKAGGLQLIDYKYWIPCNTGGDDFLTRSVLSARFSFYDDTLHIIMNHWPSRRGGVLAGEELRSKISRMVLEKADSINRRSLSGAKIIIAGDFNCTPDDSEIRLLVDHKDPDLLLTNLSEDPAEDGLGTYRYMGTWEMIDQAIVSGSLLADKHGLFTSQKMLRIFSPEFLLKKDPKYPGLSPFSTYRGYRYQGGFSDHLPVLLDLGFR